LRQIDCSGQIDCFGQIGLVVDVVTVVDVVVVDVGTVVGGGGGGAITIPVWTWARNAWSCGANAFPGHDV